MSEKSYIHKKRIVFTALSPFFKGDKLMQAMVIWDKKYSHTPSTAVQHFVYDLKNSVDGDADIRGAHLNLIKSASLPDAELLKDPSGDIDKYIQSNNLSETAEFSLPQFGALQAFILAWQRQLDWKKNQLISAYIVENIHHQKIDTTLAMSFVSWLSDRKHVIQLPNASLTDLRKIINLFYTGCCEYVGPVRSDEILDRVVQEVKSANGGKYSLMIKQLL